MQSFFLQILLIILILEGCSQNKSYSIIPSISFNSVQKQSQNGVDSVIFVIDYKDGDGDIGLAQSDTIYPYNIDGKYYNNIIIDYYEKDGSTFRRVKPPLTNIDTIQFAYRIPVLNPYKKSRPILGNIRVGVELDLPPVYSGIIKFKIRIYDKALHVSNTIETQEISR